MKKTRRNGIFYKEKSHKGDFHNDDFYEKLLNLVLPLVIQAFMLSLVSATDALMLGMIDQTSLSAVSLGGQVQFVLNLFVLGITGGLSILAAQYWGKGEHDVIERMVPFNLLYMTLIGGGFTLVTALAPRGTMKLFTNDAVLIASGASYLRTVSMSYILCAVSQVYLTMLKTTGRAAVASKISSFAVVLNIIGNAVLIFGLFGAPLLAAALVWGIAYTLYSVIMGHMGSDAVAANSITGIAKSLIACLTRGLGNGAGIMVGNVLGTGDMKLAKQYGARLTKLSIAGGVITGGLLMLLSPLIVRVAPLSETASYYLQ